jgi:hypothetical protein
MRNNPAQLSRIRDQASHNSDSRLFPGNPHLGFLKASISPDNPHPVLLKANPFPGRRHLFRVSPARFPRAWTSLAQQTVLTNPALLTERKRREPELAWKENRARLSHRSRAPRRLNPAEAARCPYLRLLLDERRLNKKRTGVISPPLGAIYISNYASKAVAAGMLDVNFMEVVTARLRRPLRPLFVLSFRPQGEIYFAVL